MAWVISVDKLYEQLDTQFGYDENRYYEFKDFLDKMPKTEAIPVSFIKEFLEGHDAVYRNNFRTLIENYNRSVDDANKVYF